MMVVVGQEKGHNWIKICSRACGGHRVVCICSGLMEISLSWGGNRLRGWSNREWRGGTCYCC